jgi:DNA processing protein
VTTRSISPADPAYPPPLAALGTGERPPPILYLRGALPALPGVAVVGTRSPSEEAVAFTRTLATALVQAGIAVWSGGAVGIDAAAHEAALDAGGVTVLVAAGGLDQPYPPQHRPLFERVLAEGGALVARVPDGTPPKAPLFLARNEVLAAMTAATVVVQAGHQSGARNTAAAARRLGRILCVVPHPPWDPRGQGCAAELVNGAVPIYGPADVLAAIGRPPPPPRRPRRRKGRAPVPQAELPMPVTGGPAGGEAGPVEAAIVEALREDAMHADEVCERTGLPGSAVLGALLTLTLRAVVVEGPAGFFRRTPPPPSS